MAGPHMPATAVPQQPVRFRRELPIPAKATALWSRSTSRRRSLSAGRSAGRPPAPPRTSPPPETPATPGQYGTRLGGVRSCPPRSHSAASGPSARDPGRPRSTRPGQPPRVRVGGQRRGRRRERQPRGGLGTGPAPAGVRILLRGRRCAARAERAPGGGRGCRPDRAGEAALGPGDRARGAAPVSRALYERGWDRRDRVSPIRSCLPPHRQS
jgi:hypothetical protein